MIAEEMLTIDDVMKRLKLGRTKVYDLLNAGKLGFIKIDRSTRIPVSEYNAFIARKRQECERG